jgi:hypothetical protein
MVKTTLMISRFSKMLFGVSDMVALPILGTMSK